MPLYGSLFSGTGAMDRGLERAGWECAFQCEIDPWRRQILARHWPGVPRWEDVRDLGAELTPVDLICAGIPCQDFSVAGKRAGLAGTRGNLFFEFARVVSLLSPRWVLVENVPGLLSSAQGDDAAEVIATFSELGYGVAWTVLDSQYFGVPQRRRRVFIVGHLGSPCPPEILFESEGGGGDTAAGGKTGESIAHALRSSPSGVDEHTGTTYVAQPLRRGRTVADSYGDEGNVVSVRLAQTSSNGWGVSEDGITHTLDETGGDAVCIPRTTVRRLTPTECTRLQGLPDNWMHTHDDPPFDDPCPRCPDGKRYAALGDGVTESVLYWIGKQILKYGY